MLSHVHYNTNRVLLVVISVYIRAVRKIFKMPGYTGYKYCAVKDCDTSTKNKTASVNLFKFPENFSDDFKTVVNREATWKPKI